MKNRNIRYTFFFLVFIYTTYFEFSTEHLYPGIRFPNFKSEWKKKDYITNKICLYSTQQHRCIRVYEIVSPNVTKLCANLEQLANKEKMQNPTVSFLQKKWKQKHPNDQLILKIIP